MEKGERVENTGGRDGVGQNGEIFWKGPNKFGPGERYGVRTDDGATFWVVEADLQRSGAPSTAPPDTGETYAKGDRVSVTQGGVESVGNVFWLGDSKAGGQRLGIKPDSGEEAIWIDARFVRRLGADAAPRKSAPSKSAPSKGAPSKGAPSKTARAAAAAEPYVPPMSMDDLPPAAPFDDHEIDWHASDGDDDLF